MTIFRPAANILLIATLCQSWSTDPSCSLDCDGHTLEEADDVALLQTSQTLRSAESRAKVKTSEFFKPSFSLLDAGPGIWFVLGPVVGIGILVLMVIYTGVKEYFEQSKDPTHEVENRKNDSLEEDAYYLAVGELVVDMKAICYPNSNTTKVLHMVRLITSLSVICLLVLVQMTIIYQVEMLVTSMSVATIRDDYDHYEFIMYGSQENHTYLNVNGKHRGYPQFFQPELFSTLPDKLKVGACNIPFSQLDFFATTLLIWTLTCLFQFKRGLELCGYVVMMPTASSMEEAVKTEMAADGDKDHLVIGMTLWLKFTLIPLLFVPWLGMTGYLLWLGSRWLASTNNFESVVGNAVALEFILNLKDLLYYVLVPDKSKRELQRIKLVPLVREEISHVRGYVVNFGWGVIAAMWVWLYIMHLQGVLPNYKWDVHDLCNRFYEKLLEHPDEKSWMESFGHHHARRRMIR